MRRQSSLFIGLHSILVLATAFAPRSKHGNGAHLRLREFQNPLWLSRVEQTTTNVLGGVESFEKWFSSVPGAKCNPSISHAAFGSLRGLEYKKGTTDLTNEKNCMTVPRSIVLCSDFSLPDWDLHLAENLWNEYSSGSSSKVSGYCSLLTLDSSLRDDAAGIPPSTAPHALRHWSNEQKSQLEEKPSGKRLLDLQKQQEELWKGKFSKAKLGLSWEQFIWAMEVVHSRSFCGDFGFGRTSFPPLVSVLIPVAAAVACFFYFVEMNGQNDGILIGLAALAAFPTIVNVATKSSPSAVLLPLIDSANHLEEADSSIEYSPLTDSFS